MFKIKNIIYLILISMLLTGCTKQEQRGVISIERIEEPTTKEETIEEEYTFTYRNTIYHTTKELSDTNEYLTRMMELDKLTKENDYNNIDELIFIRGEKYNSLYWGELMGYDNTTFNQYIEEQNNDLFQLRKESFINIPNTEYIIKPVHLAGTINCIKEGLGSIGGWKGDLCELIKELENESLTEEEIYEKAYENFSSEESTFSIYDIYTDMAAVNIASICSESDNIGDTILEYFSYIPYFNQYDLFVKNEFGENITKADLRGHIKNDMNDILTEYLLKTMKIDKNNPNFNSVCNAFADYVYDNMDHNLTGIEMFETKDEKELIKKEHRMQENKKMKELVTKFIEEGGQEKIEEYLKNLED